MPPAASASTGRRRFHRCCCHAWWSGPVRSRGCPVPAGASAHEVSDRRRSGGFRAAVGELPVPVPGVSRTHPGNDGHPGVRLQTFKGRFPIFASASCASWDSIFRCSRSAWACFGTSSMSTRCAGTIASAKPFPLLLTSPEPVAVALIHTQLETQPTIAGAARLDSSADSSAPPLFRRLRRRASQDRRRTGLEPAAGADAGSTKRAAPSAIMPTASATCGVPACMGCSRSRS